MTKIYKYKIVLLFIGVLLCSSCFDEKKIAYFQKADRQPDTISVSKAYIPRIEPGDILSIYNNSLSPEASSFFNPFTPSAGAASAGSPSASGGGSVGAATVTTPALTESASPGFLVDPSGNIEFPVIGLIKLSGLTTVEARDTIKKKLQTYVKEPTVNVRFLNYRISILGEVARPSVYIIPNERITLPEALSMAGDLTIFARRDNIQIIRDVNGKKEFGVIDLNTRDVFNSPYYYLHANDVVYVQPAKSKAEVTDHTYQLLPAVVSLISIIIVLVKK